jgi:hypothetical protein
MTRPAYSQAYETAKLDLLKQLQKRDQIDKQILKLKQTVKALGDLCGAPPDEVEKLLLIEGFAINSTMGFTEAIRRLFRMHQKALNPVEIRDDLLKIGIGREQVNLLSSIHTVLRRMVEGGEIEKTGDSRFQLTS